MPERFMTTKPLAAFVFMVVAAISTLDCSSSSSPTAPSDASAISSVTIAASTLPVGGTAQGTVTLSTPATSATTVTLTSSNAQILSVQTPITIAVGGSTGSFAITAVGAGTATITASANGGTRQSPTITVKAPSAALSITVAASSVVGGNQLNGSVTLGAPAPAGGAVVTLSATDPLIVPATVTVPAGSTAAPFTITTRAVGGTITATITASYGGASASVTLSVTKPNVATASFGVTGPTETETCTLSNDGATLNCTFNGSTSSAPGNIVAWDWSWGVATTFTQTTTGPVLTLPHISCALIPPPPLPSDKQWFTMTVTLKVHDDLGNVSAVATNSDVRLIPNGACGF
jgi:hypothetical protein